MEKKAKTSNKTVILIVILIVVVLGVILALKGTASGNAVAAAQCSDRVDNDGDGRCDFSGSRKSCIDGSVKGDTGCSSKSDNSEASCSPGNSTCGVGDCVRSSTCVNDQLSCTPGTPGTEICGDGRDNDCNGVVDNGCPTCGDGACNSGETCSSCSQDCGVCSSCGDGTCNGNETCSSCSQDCGVCNSCSDTDGGYVLTVQGTVSGIRNGQSYSSTDTCTTTTLLREFYCSGNSATNATINCATNTTSQCSNGKCI